MRHEIRAIVSAECEDRDVIHWISEGLLRILFKVESIAVVPPQNPRQIMLAEPSQNLVDDICGPR